MNSLVYSLLISLGMRMTVITVFIMLIKLAFKYKLSAGAHCAIWAVLLVQSFFCVGGVSIPAKTSIYNVVPDITDLAAAQQSVPTVISASSFDFRNLAALIYVVGAAAMLVWYVGVFFVHRRRVAKAETVEDSFTKQILSDVKARLGVMDEIVLKRGSYAHTLQNTVILPEGYSEAEQKQILLHELCHYKHRDNLKLWAAVFVLCLNWFNPIIWLAFRRFRADIEMYCDDSVLKITDDRKEYARVLVKTASDHIRFIPGASSAANGTHEVARRVKRIVSWKKKKPVWLVIAMFSCVCVSCLCLTDAVTAVVQNNVEITATPEPVEIVPAIIDAVSATAEPTLQATEPPAPAATRAPIVTAPPAAENRQRVNEAQSAPVGQPPVETAAQESAATAVQEPAAEPVTEPTAQTVGGSEEYSGTRIGESANGSKEIYSLDDGRTAVLHYDDGELETGYIISGDAAEE